MEPGAIDDGGAEGIIGARGPVIDAGATICTAGIWMVAADGGFDGGAIIGWGPVT
jgi:hypothetical protein